LSYIYSNLGFSRHVLLILHVNLTK